MQTNANLMTSARETLRGKWGLAIGASVVYALIICIAQAIPKVGWIISLLISGPMALGLAIFFLNFSRKQKVEFEQIFQGFNRYSTALVAHLWMMLFIILWALLLIIPGIVAAYSYAMTYYILVDDTKIGATDAVKKSKEMMKGNKMKLFYLSCRFIGWALLSLITLGIGFLWLIPYMQLSFANFYEDIKGGQSVENELKEVMTEKK